MPKKKKETKNVYQNIMEDCKKNEKDIVNKFGEDFYKRCMKGNIFALKDAYNYMNKGK